MDAPMKLEVITSMNQDYHDRIGRDCIKSYLEHWSTDLTVYAESVAIKPHSRLRIIEFDELGADYQTFQQDETLSRRCRTFAKKAFCVLHAMDNSAADWLVWIDADVITQRSDPVDLLKTVLQPHYLAMYMGVRYDSHEATNTSGDWLVPETGFFAVNLRHRMTPVLVQEYRRRYLNKSFSDLRRSYDNDVFGAAVLATPADYLDLCQGLEKAYKTPLKHTVFGAYLCHYKAKHSKANYALAQ